MGVFYEGPIGYNWYNASNSISTLSRGDRPWDCGRFILESTKAGINYEFNLPRLTRLIKMVTALYDTEADNIAAWNEDEGAVRACDWNLRVHDPLDANISWSEYHALAALVSLIKAAVSDLQNNSADWRHHIAQASLDASCFRSNLAAARVPSPPAPSSPLYDERLKEIAAVEAWHTAIHRARERSDIDVYDAQAKCFGALVKAFEQEQKAAAEAEEARIKTLPFYIRWPLQWKKAGKKTC